MMKKIFLTVALTAASLAPSWAQKHQVRTQTRVVVERHKESSPVRVNLYAGCELSNVQLFLHGLRVTSERELFSPTVGVDVRIPINNSNFFVSPGLSYNRKGIRFSTTVPGEGVASVRTPIHFISGNILGGFKVGNKDFSLIGAYGLYAGYAASGKAIIKHSSGSGRVMEEEFDLYKPIKNIDLGDFMGGAAPKVKSQSPLNRFDLGFRASLGFEFANHYTLTLTSDRGLINQSNDETIRLFHRSMAVTVGYTF